MFYDTNIVLLKSRQIKLFNNVKYLFTLQIEIESFDMPPNELYSKRRIHIMF